MERVNSSIRYLIHCKNFCKCHNVPPPNTIKKIFNINEKKRKWILLPIPEKKLAPDFSPVTSDLHCETINLQCFKSLSLWLLMKNISRKLMHKQS
jgi:hypothetical protein